MSAFMGSKFLQTASIPQLESLEMNRVSELSSIPTYTRNRLMYFPICMAEALYLVIFGENLCEG